MSHLCDTRTNQELSVCGITPGTLVCKLHKRNSPLGSDIGANEALVTVRTDRCDSEDEIINRNIVEDEMSCIADNLIAFPID